LDVYVGATSRPIARECRWVQCTHYESWCTQ